MNKLNYITNTKKALNISTDSDLAKELKVTRQSVSLWRNGNTSPDEYACFRIANILMIDPRKVIADIKKESEKDINKRNFWEKESKQYGFAESYLLAGISIFMMIVVSSILFLRDKMSTLISIGHETYIDVLINFSSFSDALFLFTGICIMRNDDADCRSSNCILA